MGFFRKSGLVILSIILFLLLLLSGVLLIFSLSLSHDNVQKEFGGFLRENILINIGNSGEVNQNYIKMVDYCKNNTEYKLNDENENLVIVIPCSEIDKGQESVIGFMSNSLIDKFYYTKYNCNSFGNCLDVSKQGEVNGFPAYIFSNQFRGYLIGKFFIVLLIIFACFVLIYFLAEMKTNFLVLIGCLISGCALVLLGLEKISLGLLSSIISTASQSGFSIERIISHGLSYVFWMYLILGIILIISGVALKVIVYFRVKDV